MGGNPYKNFRLSFISQFIHFKFLVKRVFIVKYYLCFSTVLCLQVSKGMNRDGVCIHSCQYAHRTTRGSNSDSLNLSLIRMHE